MEEHSIIGGLGSAISEVLSEGGAKAKFARHGLPDRFVGEVGSQAYLRKLNSLDPDGIARRAMSLIK